MRDLQFRIVDTVLEMSKRTREYLDSTDESNKCNENMNFSNRKKLKSNNLGSSPSQAQPQSPPAQPDQEIADSVQLKFLKFLFMNFHFYLIHQKNKYQS